MNIEVIAFKTEYAVKYGVEAAILIQGIQLGLHLNKSKPTHVKMGTVWMYNSVREWHEAYPFMSESTIKRTLNKLKEVGIIKVMQLDSNPMNKTNWYTLTIPLGQNDPIDRSKLNQSKQYKTNNVKQTINIEGKTEKPKSVFTPPTFEEIKKYAQSRGAAAASVDLQRFHDFYTSKGWMVGKNKMKDWEAAFRTWESRDAEEKKPLISKNVATLNDD
jgi:DNA-binding HxlR family transcriptional regulator